MVAAMGLNELASEIIKKKDNDQSDMNQRVNSDNDWEVWFQGPQNDYWAN